MLHIALLLTALMPAGALVTDDAFHIRADGRCEYPRGGGPKAFEEWEQACIAGAAGRVARDGERLTLRLDDGGTRTFESNWRACEEPGRDGCVVWTYHGYYNAITSYILLGECREFCNLVRFVNAVTGEIVEAEDFGRISPRGDRMAVIACNEAGGLGLPEISAYDVVGGQLAPVKIRSEAAVEGCWKLVEWRGNDTVRLEVADYGCRAVDGRALLKPAMLHRSGDVWHLEVEQGCSEPLVLGWQGGTAASAGAIRPAR